MQLCMQVLKSWSKISFGIKEDIFLREFKLNLECYREDNNPIENHMNFTL